MCVTAVTLGYLGQVCPEAAAWRHCACLVCVRWLLPTTAASPGTGPLKTPCHQALSGPGPPLAALVQHSQRRPAARAVSGKSVKTLLARIQTGSLPMSGSRALRRSRRW